VEAKSDLNDFIFIKLIALEAKPTQSVIFLEDTGCKNCLFIRILNYVVLTVFEFFSKIAKPQKKNNAARDLVVFLL